jgi:hypothetical protein
MGHDIRPSHAEDIDDDDDDELLLEEHHHIEDDHHSWLGGTTALKFLAAGGVAGAGQNIARIYQAHRLINPDLTAKNSFADSYSSVRSFENIPHN